MSMIPVYEKDIERLGRSSRTAALLSLGGFVIVMFAIAFAVFHLRQLARERFAAMMEIASLQRTVSSLRDETQLYTHQLSTLRLQLERARASLSAARAAIEAFHAGNLKAAVKLYDEALEYDPHNAYLLDLRAYSLFRLRRLNAALRSARQSVAADPKYAWGYFDLARFLCARAHIEDARTAAQRAIVLDPSMRSLMESDGEFQRLCRHAVP
jgi:tetratricopeptide (TPR) repeat protein